MSLADHIRKQEECRQELEPRLNDLGIEFAAQIRDLGLPVIPVMDRNGTSPYDYRQSREQGYSSDMKPTGAMAFPLFVAFQINAFYAPIFAITPDGAMILTEKLVHRESSGGWSGSYTDPDNIREHVLMYSGAMGDMLSWKEPRERDQLERFTMLSEVAYRVGIQQILQPIELAMLDIYNDARRRQRIALRSQ